MCPDEKVQELALKSTNASKKRLNFSNCVAEAKKQRTAEDSEDLENSFEQLEMDRVEEPTRKRGRPKKYLSKPNLPGAAVDRGRLLSFLSFYCRVD